jgi:hypothetical protein
MRKTIICTFSLVLFIVAGLFYGCSDNSTSPSDQNGSVMLYLTDAPADFDGVFIVVDKVEVNANANASNSDNGWITLNSTTHTYNLMSLRNGVEVAIADTALAAGTYAQVRLVLGSGSYVVVGGVKFNLNVSSNLQAGIRIAHKFTVSVNSTANLTIDFNVNRSIKVIGSGSFTLQPSIRIIDTDNSGSISGMIMPLDADAIVWTKTASNDTVTAYPDSSGYFKLSALPPDNGYSVNVHAQNIGFNDTTITNVNVIAQKDKDLGTITLSNQ